ncbi:MAG: ATP-dependent sacrificial sulfur transferase LarE [Deltaproteobacteria bacterium]|nr:ATP-dependent sacrificial sulfur transferase LarE [Deltaproteobacteria bacterium]
MTRESVFEKKVQALRSILGSLDAAIVSFSGGVDSAYLLAEAVSVLGSRAWAFTADSPSLPRAELAAARKLAMDLGVATHRVGATHELDLPAYTKNASDRCYVCKQEMMRHAVAAAAILARQITATKVAGTTECEVTILVGTNVDDLGGHLPGLKAVKEAGARMPLVEAGLTKADIRRRSADLGLPTADKPELACLASRLPTGTEITAARLARVEAFEGGLAALGFRGFRVRFHEPIARIELAPQDLARAIEPGCREAIVALGKGLGFRFVTLDLAGYRRGSLSDELMGDEAKA